MLLFIVMLMTPTFISLLNWMCLSHCSLVLTVYKMSKIGQHRIYFPFMKKRLKLLYLEFIPLWMSWLIPVMFILFPHCWKYLNVFRDASDPSYEDQFLSLTPNCQSKTLSSSLKNTFMASSPIDWTTVTFYIWVSLISPPLAVSPVVVAHWPFSYWLWDSFTYF